MKALKGVVIGMGVLILLGLGVVVAAIVGQVNDSGETARTSVRLDLPPACQIGDIEALDNRLAVRVNGPDGANCPSVLLLDQDTGEVRTTIRGPSAGASSAEPEGG